MSDHTEQPVDEAAAAAAAERQAKIETANSYPFDESLGFTHQLISPDGSQVISMAVRWLTQPPRENTNIHDDDLYYHIVLYADGEYYNRVWMKVDPRVMPLKVVVDMMFADMPFLKSLDAPQTVSLAERVWLRLVSYQLSVRRLEGANTAGIDWASFDQIGMVKGRKDFVIPAAFHRLSLYIGGKRIQLADADWETAATLATKIMPWLIPAWNNELLIAEVAERFKLRQVLGIMQEPS